MQDDRPLSDQQFDTLASYVDQVDGGEIDHIEAHDGFLTALAVCPELSCIRCRSVDPPMPSGKAGWLCERGISAARLF